MTEVVDVDWTGVAEPIVRQILAQGELYLQSQQALAIAADQRASTAASIFASTGAAVSAAIIAFYDKIADAAALWAGLTGSFVLIAAAILAAFAARPTKFYVPGNHPQSWFANRHADLIGMLGGEAELVQSHILKNDEIMTGNQRLLIGSFFTACASPLLAYIVWMRL